MTVLPILYKKTSTGAIQQWKIEAVGDKIVTDFGQQGGAIQRTIDTAKRKNVGRANETTPTQQAAKEAISKHEKKLKSGYSLSIKDAEAGNDGLAVKAMLAHSYEKHGAKMQWPALIQPKLDGMRCLAVIKDGVAKLYTRTGKPILSVPHIVEELEAAYEEFDLTLDGELYNHDLHDQFEKLISLCRKSKPVPEAEGVVQYHIYDRVTDQDFQDREILLPAEEYAHLKRVATGWCDSEKKMMEAYDKLLDKGYEGIMVRQGIGGYEGKRSYNLLKYKGELHVNSKHYSEEEFKIVGIVEGKGKLQGHIGSFVCMTSENVTFKVKLDGSNGRLKELFDNPEQWEGNYLTVKYQGRTTKNNVPRFPIGKEIRDYE